MRKRAELRSRRALLFVIAAGVVAGAVAAGTGGGWLATGGSKRTAAATSQRAPVWVAGETASQAKRQAHRSTTKSSTRARRQGNHAHPSAVVRSNTARKLEAAVSVDLCAKAGSATMADGTTVPIWGFAPSCGDPATLPGPVLNADDGDVVTLTITNNLPAGHTISIEAPGVDIAPGPTDAAPGETVSLTFTAAEGTYLYDSAGDAGRQEAMGLYGALVVHSGVPGQEHGVAVAAQHTLVLSEIDPAFNADPDAFDMNAWHPKYWLINGHDYPDTETIAAAAGTTVLLRYANAGVDHNTMSLLGLHQRLLARDGSDLENPFSIVSETFPAGETADAIVAIPATAPSGTRYALYNRNLNLGMSTFLQVR